MILLLLLLSIATIAWGAVTGTWFGSSAIASWRALNWMIVPSLSSFDPRSSETVKWLCFIIGTVHISIARIWSFIRTLRLKPAVRAFSHLGWLSIVLGLYYLVLNIVLDPIRFPVPYHALAMIGGGLVFVIVFGEQDGKFFRGLLKGFAGLLSTFLDSIGAFSDIVSYIRLFAVGLASIEIAKAFNAMASSMANGAVGIAAAVFVLLIGHALNVAMGALSVIVHGVRLNILEFSGHLGMEWTGFQYRPFGGEEHNED
jgi:V/A-type H+-transporting ATPase subunit I